MKLRNASISVAASLLLASTAFAHGDEDHAVKPSDKTVAHEHHHGEGDEIGVAGDAKHIDRTVNVDMSDTMRFTPADIAVRQGETVRFVLNNTGKVKHEMVLGTEEELKEHYELMKKFPEMEHSDPQMVTVAPGQAGEIVWRFTKSGKVNFACLQPGHYDAGMKGLVTVAVGNAAGANADGHSDHKH